MKKKYIFNALLSVIILAIPLSPAWAGQGGPPRDTGMEGPGDDEFGRHGHKSMCFGDDELMKEKLDLSEEQISRIGKINIEFRKKQLEEREKLQPKKTRLKKLLLEENINLNDVEKLLREISDVEIQVRLNRIRHRIEIEKVLTPEQKEKLRQEKRRFLKYHD